MKKNKFEDLNLEEIKSQKIKIKKVFVALSCTLLIVNILLVFFIFKSKLYPLFAVVFGSMMTLLPIYINLTQLNEEIKSRQPENQKDGR